MCVRDNGCGMKHENIPSMLGRVLAEAQGLRERIVLASKGGIRPPVPYDSSREALVAACEASLGRLGVDPLGLDNLHIQQVMRARMGDEVGIGVMEQLCIGPHAPSGFTEYLDGAK